MHPSPRRLELVRGRLSSTTWESARWSPHPALRGLVRSVAGYHESTVGPLTRTELPHPGVVVILELGPPLEVAEAGAPRGARHPGGFVAGLYEDVARCRRHDGTQTGIQIDLTPRGARRLFGVPLHELTNRPGPLRELLPAAYRDLSERLAELAWPERLARLEAVLRERLLDPKQALALGSGASAGTLLHEVQGMDRHKVPSKPNDPGSSALHLNVVLGGSARRRMGPLYLDPVSSIRSERLFQV